MKIKEGIFGSLSDKNVKFYTVTNDNGMEITCIEYGCTITRINVPDQEGKIENVVLGFDSLEEYEKGTNYFGCIIGRTAGRIENASFHLDDSIYKLAKNDGNNSLHGGPNGFHRVIWDSSVEVLEDEIKLSFYYTSADGEEGFPGNLKVKVTYIINNENELVMAYEAQSDKKTVVNLTNHSYFNLSGNLKRNILGHELFLKSDSFLELDSTLIPTGRVMPTKGTVFDFTCFQKVSRGMESEHSQIKRVGGGYDHPFLLNANHQKEIILWDKVSGRTLGIETEEPCVVFYSGNMLNADQQIRGRQCEKYLGLCLETQKPPNMINQSHFPTSVLDADQVYTSKTKYTFNLI